MYARAFVIGTVILFALSLLNVTNEWREPMVRFLACSVFVLGLVLALQGEDVRPAKPSLQQLHKRKCDLLAQRLSDIETLVSISQATGAEVWEAKIRLYLAQAEATTDDVVRRGKQEAVLKLLEGLVEGTKSLLDVGGTTPASYHDIQLRLIETQLSFEKNG